MCAAYNKEHQGNVNPWECVKWRGFVTFKDHPSFNDTGIYTFAVEILEGKPVFVGDKVYAKHNGAEVIVNPGVKCMYNIHNYELTWTPPAPKRTFTLNGVEFPCPVENRDKQYTDRHFASLQFEFATAQEGEEFMSKLRAILDKAQSS